MKMENLYSIKYVTLQTGLTHHVIRAWERRYGAVNPRRTPKNRRVYSAEDIERLKVLKLLTSRGHKISHVARLKANELQSLVRQVVRTDSQGQRTHSALRHTASAEDLCQACLAAVLDLDQERLERVYDQAAISLTSAALLADVIVPLLYEIGALWRAGKLKIINEHMASTVTRTVLLNMLRDSLIPDRAPKIVVATAAAQTHELGALVVALKAAERGWHPLYYGPNLPAEEIAYGVKSAGAHVVALSITHAPNLQSQINELRKLRRYLDHDVAIMVGGSAVGGNADTYKDLNIIHVKNIDRFSIELDKLTKGKSDG